MLCIRVDCWRLNWAIGRENDGNDFHRRRKLQSLLHRFRILTIDGGLLSFEDFRFGQPIYAVVSNPKPAKFLTPREPLQRISQSTHVR